MATRSSISLLALDGTVSSLYCHNDGYIDGNGILLYQHYQDINKIKELISFGDLSSLGEEVSPPINATHSFDNRIPDITVFYGRDRGETDIDAKTYESIDEYKSDGNFQEYNYLFKEKNNTWYLYNEESQKFQKLKTALKKEAKTNTHIKDILELQEKIESIVAEKEMLNKTIPPSTVQKQKQTKI